jgi:cytochrome c2
LLVRCIKSTKMFLIIKNKDKNIKIILYLK